MDQIKIGALMVSAALLSACGGGGSDGVEDGNGGGGNPPAQSSPLVLGDYQSQVSVGELQTLDVTIPFTNADGPVNVTVSHALPLSYTVEVGDNAAVVSMDVGDVSYKVVSGDVAFTVSDPNDMVSGSFELAITNTSGEPLVAEIENVIAAMPMVQTLPEYQTMFSAYGELARYSGAINANDYSQAVASFERGLDGLVELCGGCEEELVQQLREYDSGNFDEAALREGTFLFTLNLSEYVDETVRDPFNAVVRATGREPFPATSFVYSDEHGLTAVMGNPEYGTEVGGEFIFDGEYAILNDVFGVDGAECDVLGGER